MGQEEIWFLDTGVTFRVAHASFNWVVVTHCACLRESRTISSVLVELNLIL